MFVDFVRIHSNVISREQLITSYILGDNSLEYRQIIINIISSSSIIIISSSSSSSSVYVVVIVAVVVFIFFTQEIKDIMNFGAYIHELGTFYTTYISC